MNLRVMIAGRSNVGKSTLFNRLLRRKKSIVSSKEGVTRDYLEVNFEITGKNFVLIDSGGLYHQGNDGFSEIVSHQSESLVGSVDLILFVVEAGKLTALDEEVANLLRKQNKQVFLVANKIDKYHYLDPGFYRLGFHPIISVSAEHNRGIAELRSALYTAVCAHEESDEAHKEDIKISIFGRPNVGKSTLLNAFAGYQRSLVHSTPGLTRDSVSTHLRWRDKDIVCVDTAGLRRKSTEDLEFYAGLRTIQSIRSSRVCLLLIDSTLGIKDHDLHLLSLAHSEGKACCVFFNKMDLFDGHEERKKQEKALKNHPLIENLPLVFGSAKQSKGLLALKKMLLLLSEKTQRRVETSKVNRFLPQWIANHPVLGGSHPPLKVRYISQTSHSPVTFVFFLNTKKIGSAKSYYRYFVNCIRRDCHMEYLPIVIIFRSKEDSLTVN